MRFKHFHLYWKDNKLTYTSLTWDPLCPIDVICCPLKSKISSGASGGTRLPFLFLSSHWSFIFEAHSFSSGPSHLCGYLTNLLLWAFLLSQAPISRLSLSPDNLVSYPYFNSVHVKQNSCSFLKSHSKFPHFFHAPPFSLQLETCLLLCLFLPFLIGSSHRGSYPIDFPSTPCPSSHLYFPPPVPQTLTLFSSRLDYRKYCFTDLRVLPPTHLSFLIFHLVNMCTKDGAMP